MSTLNDVRVFGAIGPPDSTDTFATQDAIWGRDGWRSVADATERNAITADRRRQGMAAILQSDNSIWILNAQPWNFDDGDWTAIPGGFITLTGDATGSGAGTIAVTVSSYDGGTPFGTMAAQNSDSVAITGGTITGLPTPINPMDAVNKAYVDSLTSGLTFTPPGCRLATTANLTATYNNGTAGVGATLTNSGAQVALSLDGVATSPGDYVLIKDQSTQFQNGIYTVTNIGSGSTNWVLTRATSFDQASEIFQGSYTVVASGTANAGTLWIQTSATPLVVGTDAIVWTKLVITGTGTVIQVNTGTGLAGGPITSSGTISVANSTDNTLAGYNNTGVFSDVTIGVGLSLSGGVLSSTTSGTVTSLTAGTGISLSPSTITSSGSISVANSTNNTLAGYDNGGVFSDVSVGTGLSLLGGSLFFVGTTAVYDNATSGLSAATVQGAIDELSQIVGQVSGTFLVSGGQVVWVSGYTFTVSAATYYILGVLYSSTMQNVTLPASDPSLDRIDVIYVDNTGAVGSITGTPAVLPIVPQVDPSTQLLLTPILVTAASTGPPNITTILVYNDNTGPPAEWTASTNSAGTININSTNNPYTGTKDIEATNAVAGNYVQFQAPSPLDASTQTYLVFYVRVKAAWPKNKVLNASFLSSGTSVGVTVTVTNGSFGFSSSLTGSYQQIAIPITNFGLIAGSTENQVRIAVSGGGAAIGFYLDYVQLQQDGNQPPGILPVPDGGTGVGTFVPYALLAGGVTTTGPIQQVSGLGTTGQVLVSNGASALPTWQTLPTGSGSVTNVSVVTANGLAGTVATPTTTPAITLRTTITGILQGNGTAISAITIGAGLSFTGGTLSATGGGSGSVTSVGLSMPTEFTVSGSPVTTSGTLAVTKANQSANLFYLGPPSGGAAPPTFRIPVAADIPLGIIPIGSLANIPATTVVANPTGVSAPPSTVTLGAGLAFSGSTLLVPVNGISTSQVINSAITYAKIQQMSDSTLMGNPTGSTANPSEITLDATNLVFNGSALSCLGGLRTVATHAARNALISGEPNTCAEGMVVYTRNASGTDGLRGYWELLAQPWTGTDSDWVPAGPLDVEHNGTDVAARGTINLIDGSNVTLTVADNPTDDRVDITIASTAGGGTVTSITAGNGLFASPNPIVGSGTISVADGTADTLAGYDDSGVFSGVTIGTGLSLASGTLSATGGGGVPSGTAGQTLIYDSTAAAFSSIIEAYSATSPNATGTNSVVLNGDGGTASGVDSVAEGFSTTAGGDQSHAEGYLTQATGDGSHAEGFSTTAGGLNSHAEGHQTTASGAGSHAEGNGFGNAASGDYSHTEGNLTTAGGFASHCEGDGSAVDSGADAGHAEGGSHVTSNGSYGHAEGIVCTVDSWAGHAGGNGSIAGLYAQWARSDGGLSSVVGGFGQYGVISAAIQTTDATPANLSIGPIGTTRNISITINHLVAFVATIVARKSDGSNAAMMIRQGMIQNLGGTTAMIGNIGTIGADINSPGWDVAISADDANDCLQIQVTGAAATTINWMATIQFTEVK